MWLEFTSKITKKSGIDDVVYMFHGTSPSMAESILHNGLLANPEKRHFNAEEYIREHEPSIESYPGVYFSKNWTTAYGSGNQYSRQLKQESNCMMVIVQIDLSSENIVMDEDTIDHISERSFVYAYKDIGILFTEHTAGDEAKYNFPRLDQMIEEYYLSLFSDSKFKNISEQVKSSIKNATKDVVSNLIKSRIKLQVAIQLEYENKQKQLAENGEIQYHWDRYTPTYGDIVGSRQEEEAEYRTNFDNFLRKAHQLVEYMDRNEFFFNVRSTENIGFEGPNKIVLMVEILESDDPRFYRIEKIVYGDDPKAIELMIEESKKRLAEELLMIDQNGIIIYQKEKSPTQAKSLKNIKTAQDYIPEWEREKRQRPFALPSRENDSGMPETNNLFNPVSVLPVQKLTIPPWFEFITIDQLTSTERMSMNFIKQLKSGWLAPDGKFFPVDEAKHWEFEKEIFQNNGMDYDELPITLEQFGWQHISYGNWIEPEAWKKAPPATAEQKDFLTFWSNLVSKDARITRFMKRKLGIE